jgi:hypothetical protein
VTDRRPPRPGRALVREVLADVAAVLGAAAFLLLVGPRGGFGTIILLIVAAGGLVALIRLVRTVVVASRHGAAAALDPLPELQRDRPQADPTDHDRFLVAQAVTPVINRYEVATLAPDGRSADRAVLYVEQKRFKLREELIGYADASKTRQVLRIKARQVIDLGATYDVTGPDGEAIGLFRKDFGGSFLRSTWHVHAASGEPLATARERNLLVALWRRLVDLVPLVGELLSLLPIPYHFDFRRGDALLGGLTRRRTIRDRYVLDLTGDPERTLDRRLAIALAVGLDALQSR